jgi:hypothetical protein
VVTVSTTKPVRHADERTPADRMSPAGDRGSDLLRMAVVANPLVCSLVSQESEHVAAEAAGGVAANALALALGGPELAQFVGPAAAPVFTQALRRVSSELEARGLSPWRRHPVSTAWDFAATAMRDRVAAGQAPRTDLFEPQRSDSAEENPRTTAEELLEEVVRIAGDAADERKIPYLAPACSLPRVCRRRTCAFSARHLRHSRIGSLLRWP